ncbi:hypothetical protein Aduo_014379 [Ancylostoma duodenale]
MLHPRLLFRGTTSFLEMNPQPLLLLLHHLLFQLNTSCLLVTYVEPATVVTSSQPKGQSHPLDSSQGLTAVAIYDYQKNDDDEISFEPDDIITNIEQIDAGWWRGVCNGQYGLFPANYVELR